MTARESTIVEVDAGTVYAEGMRNGLKTAMNLVARSGQQVPPSLRREHVAWTAHAIHREWLAEQGRPVLLEQSDEALSFIHAVLRQTGLRAS